MPIKFKAADKYHRMRRSYENLRIVSTDTGNIISLSQAKEAVEDFFTHCYHLKDWLIKELPSLKLTTEDYVTKSAPLSLAADYCIPSNTADWIDRRDLVIT